MENKNNSEEAYSNLEYIKTIMTKAEMGYEAIGQMFLKLAVAYVVSSATTILLRKLLRYSIVNTGYKGIFITLLIECIIKVCIFIILLLFLKQTGIKLKKANQEHGLWLFRILFYLIIVCNIIFPITVIAVIGYTDTTDIFELISVALNMQICGVFLNDRKLRKAAYIYVGIPLILLAAVGLWDKYIQVINEGNTTALFAKFYAWVKFVFYHIYPVLGCLYIAYKMKKEKRKSELQ